MKITLAAALMILGLAMAPLASRHRGRDRPHPGAGPGGALAIAVTVPAGADLIFLSGALGPFDAKAPAGSTQAFGGDTRAQAVGALTNCKRALAGLGLTMGDVVQAHVFLAGDPAKGGDIDFAGLNAAWAQFFGGAEQPNKPARSTVKVAGLVAPGALVEIELVAARVK